MLTKIFRPLWAFVFRDFHLTRRYIHWEVVNLFYAMVSSATVALIGVASKDFRLTLRLTLGVLLWNFLSSLFHEIANSISYERWEGTLEYTFMAPVSRLQHLLGVSSYASVYALLRSFVVLGGLYLFIPMTLRGANMAGVVLVIAIGGLAFMGLGLMAAVLPLMSPERGASATEIFQGVLLLVSGVYYPVEVLPSWIRPLSVISPAKYALDACRKLMGTDNPASTNGHLAGASLSSVTPLLLVLALMGIILIPAGLYVFGVAEKWAKKTGKLKRTG